MSKKQHQKQIARAQAKRRASVQQRRSRRTRIVAIAIVALLVIALVASAAGGGLFGGDDTADPDEPEVDLEATEGPCGPTPEDVPDVASETYDEPFEFTIDEDATYVATMDTTCGQIVVELEAQNAPIATNNFINLAREGFYEGVEFHRVIPGFMIQGGDPEGTGAGGPGYTFEDELERAQELFAEVEQAGLDALGDRDDEELPEGLVPGGYPRGVLAMANAGPDTNGSQFFITQGDPAALPGPDYTVFGTVLEGMGVVDDIAASPTGEADRPLEPVVIRSVTIEAG